VVQPFLQAVVLQNEPMDRIGWKYSVSFGAANRCVGTPELVYPRNLWLSGARAWRDVVGLWSLVARGVVYDASADYSVLV